MRLRKGADGEDDVGDVGVAEDDEEDVVEESKERVCRCWARWQPEPHLPTAAAPELAVVDVHGAAPSSALRMINEIHSYFAAVSGDVCNKSDIELGAEGHPPWQLARTSHLTSSAT